MELRFAICPYKYPRDFVCFLFCCVFTRNSNLRYFMLQFALGQCHGCPCLRKKVGTNLFQYLQNLAAIALSHAYYMITFWRSSIGFLFFKIPRVFCQDQTLYWSYLGIGWSDWHETKRSALVGYEVNMWHWTWNLPMTLTSDFSRSNFEISQEVLAWLIRSEKTEREFRHWFNYNTLFF